MVDDEVLVQRHEGVATVTLNRPARSNALTSTMIGALPGLMTGLDRDDDVQAIVLTGAGRAFCAGLDLGELSGTGENIRVARDGRPWPRLRTPVIGAVNGPAVTGGLEIALWCDLLVASDRARFADTHARVGVLPGWGLSVLLPEAVGMRRAKEMSATGNYVDAHTAERWGLVNHVVPHEQLMEHARGLAEAMVGEHAETVSALFALYDDNAESAARDGARRELAAARSWLEQRFDPARVAERRSGLQRRGRAQAE